MWYESFYGSWPETFRRILVEEKNHINLGYLKAVVMGDDTELIESKTLNQINEETLSYLQSLLKEGLVRVGMLNPEKVASPKDWIGKTEFVDVPGTPDEVIEYVRSHWSDPELGQGYELVECAIILAENPWPKIKFAS